MKSLYTPMQAALKFRNVPTHWFVDGIRSSVAHVVPVEVQSAQPMADEQCAD